VFFEQHFPDALDWAGEERLLSDFEKNPRGALVTINVSRIARSDLIWEEGGS
jgi:kynurenine 3-monooxygenase